MLQLPHCVMLPEVGVNMCIYSTVALNSIPLMARNLHKGWSYATAYHREIEMEVESNAPSTS